MSSTNVDTHKSETFRISPPASGPATRHGSPNKLVPNAGRRPETGNVSKEVQAERAAELEEAVEDQERSELPILNGSAKQVDWAVTVRYELLRDAYTSLVEEGTLEEDSFENHVLVPARRVTAARWWIDNRDNGALIVEILADPGQIDVGETNENPY